MSEIEKALAELKALMAFRAKELGHAEEFRALGLTSRKNLCLHPEVKREKKGTVVDARCRSLTAGFVKEKKEKGEDVELCIYHEVQLRQSEIWERCANKDAESLPERAPQFDTSGRLHLRWVTEIRRARENMPLLHSSANGIPAIAPLHKGGKLTKAQMPHLNVIIYSYHYLLDPKIAERVSKELSKECIVVFDEAHNIGE